MEKLIAWYLTVYDHYIRFNKRKREEVKKIPVYGRFQKWLETTKIHKWYVGMEDLELAYHHGVRELLRG